MSFEKWWLELYENWKYFWQWPWNVKIGYSTWLSSFFVIRCSFFVKVGRKVMKRPFCMKISVSKDFCSGTIGSARGIGAAGKVLPLIGQWIYRALPGHGDKHFSHKAFTIPSIEKAPSKFSESAFFRPANSAILQAKNKKAQKIRCTIMCTTNFWGFGLQERKPDIFDKSW